MLSNKLHSGIEKPTQGQELRDRWILLVCSIVVVAALLLEVQAHERVGVTLLGGLQLPGLCMSREIFGISCPGCGLTRSFVYLVHGQIEASYRAHRVGPLFAILIALQLPYRLWSLCWSQYRWPFVTCWNWIAISLIVILVLNWLNNLLD